MVAPVQALVMEAAVIDPAVQAALRETAARRILSPELETALSNEALNDPLTEQLRGWHRDFIAALNIAVAQGNGAVGYTEDRYKDLLARILRDPLTGPFEEDVFLGSDGRTYNRITLYMFRNGVPERYRNRSPLDPLNEAVFTDQPHPIARHFVRWLNIRDNLFTDARTRERRAAQAVFDRDMTVRIAGGEQGARAARREAALAARVAEETERRRAALNARFAPVDAMDAAAHAAIAAEIQRPDEEERLRGIAMRAEVDAMAVDVEAMLADLPAMRARNAEHHNQIEGLDHRYAEINVQVQATAKAIDDKKKDEMGDALKAIAIIGVCCFAAWGISLLIPAGAPAAGTAGVSQGTGTAGFAIFF
ncbi:MAG: hypothetical protein NTX49_10150 [Chlamydiae bacterium]|nr:hypothetical protein [Chlamydiota bacterium]